jgi:hypothetical protein
VAVPGVWLREQSAPLFAVALRYSVALFGLLKVTTTSTALSIQETEYPCARLKNNSSWKRSSKTLYHREKLSRSASCRPALNAAAVTAIFGSCVLRIRARHPRARASRICPASKARCASEYQRLSLSETVGIMTSVWTRHTSNKDGDRYRRASNPRGCTLSCLAETNHQIKRGLAAGSWRPRPFGGGRSGGLIIGIVGGGGGRGGSGPQTCESGEGSSGGG